MKISRAIWASAATAVLALGWLVLPNTVKQAQALPGMQGGGTQGPAGADGAAGPPGTPGFGGGVNVSTGGPNGYIAASSITVTGAIEQSVIGSSVNWKVNLSSAMNAIASTGTLAAAAMQAQSTTAVVVANLATALASTGTTAAAAMQAASTAATVSQSSMTNLAALGTINTATNPMEWTKLKNVPAAVTAGSTFTGVLNGGAAFSTFSVTGSGGSFSVTGGVGTLNLTGGAGGGSSALEVRVPNVFSSSPTLTLNFGNLEFTGTVNGTSVTITLNPNGVFSMDHLTARTLIVTSSISLTGAPGYVVHQTTEVGFSFNASPGSTFYVMRSSIVAEDFYVKLGSVTVETLLSTGAIYASQFFGTWSGSPISTVAAQSVTLPSIVASGTRDSTTFLRGDGTFATPNTGSGGGSSLEVWGNGVVSSSPTASIRVDTNTIIPSASGSTATLAVNLGFTVMEQYVGWISADDGVAVSTVIGSTPGVSTAGYGVPNHQVADSTATAEIWMVLVDSKTIQKNIQIQLVTITTGTEPSDVWEGIAVGTCQPSGCGIADVPWISSTTVILSSTVAGVQSRIKRSAVITIPSSDLIVGSVPSNIVLLVKRWNIPPPRGSSVRMHQPPVIYLPRKNQ